MARRSNPALSTAKQEPSNERIFTAPLRLWQGRAMSRWFRFYADAMRNPKVGRLSDKEFRLWVELLSVAAENDGLIPCLSDLKHVLKRRLDHLSTGVKQLISVGLIDALEVGYEPHNWSKFQYKSDVSTERVKRHREKRNVSETPPDTDTDTDTEEAKDDSLPGIGIDPDGPKPGEKGDDDLPQDLLGVIPPGRVKPGAIACPGQEIANLWDRILCPEAAAIAQWNPRRARVLGARWKEQAESEGWQSKAEGLKWFEDLFTGCRRSRFLMGKVPPKNGNLQFKLKFDWFFGPENFTRVVEGDFHRGN